ncbi:unnamed protein product, partial [Scytosiphon promiscuus]
SLFVAPTREGAGALPQSTVSTRAFATRREQRLCSQEPGFVAQVVTGCFFWATKQQSLPHTGGSSRGCGTDDFVERRTAIITSHGLQLPRDKSEAEARAAYVGARSFGALKAVCRSLGVTN